MSETKTYPKCNGEMRIGYLSNAWRWIEGKSLWGFPKSKAYAYACQNCGYIEFYIEQKADTKKSRLNKLVKTLAGIVLCVLDSREEAWSNE